MVKECLVKINNEAITVVRYGDTDIQFPSIHKDVNTVFVAYEGGKYNTTLSILFLINRSFFYFGFSKILILSSRRIIPISSWIPLTSSKFS